MELKGDARSVEKCGKIITVYVYKPNFSTPIEWEDHGIFNSLYRKNKNYISEMEVYKIKMEQRRDIETKAKSLRCDKLQLRQNGKSFTGKIVEILDNGSHFKITVVVDDDMVTFPSMGDVYLEQTW